MAACDRLSLEPSFTLGFSTRQRGRNGLCSGLGEVVRRLVAAAGCCEEAVVAEASCVHLCVCQCAAHAEPVHLSHASCYRADSDPGEAARWAGRFSCRYPGMCTPDTSLSPSPPPVSHPGWHCELLGTRRVEWFLNSRFGIAWGAGGAYFKWGRWPGKVVRAGPGAGCCPAGSLRGSPLRTLGSESWAWLP